MQAGDMDQDLGKNHPPPDETPLVYTVVRQTWLSRKPSASARFITTVSLLVLVLICSVYWSGLWGLASWLPASGADVFEKKQLWRLWTTLFVHGDVKHLVSNSFLFYILGYFLSGYFGWRVFPLTAFLMGGIINLVALWTYPPTTQLVGASGVVFWMGGAWLFLYSVLNTKVSRTQRFLRAIGVTLALFFPSEAFDPQVSYRTHMIGLALGALWGAAFYLVHRQQLKAAEISEIVTE